MAGKPSVTRLTHSRYSLEHHGCLLAPVIVTLPINFPGGALALVLYVHVHGLVDLHLIVLLVLVPRAGPRYQPSDPCLLIGSYLAQPRSHDKVAIIFIQAQHKA